MEGHRNTSIFTTNIPEAYWEWYKKICKENSYITMEIVRGIISVVRTRQPVEDESAIRGIQYAKFIKDASGCYIERTYVPQYFKDENIVRSP